jgi:hypothetical protein
MADKTVEEKLDAIFDAITKRQDEADARMDCMAKKDSEREEADAKAKKDAEEKADEKAKKDAAEKEETDAKAKKDAEEAGAKAKKDADDKKESDEKAAKDAAARSSDSTLATRLADIEKRLPAHMTSAEVTKFTDAQRRAERVVQAFGDSAGADRWANGETYDAYRRRLLGTVKSHSAQWKDVDLTAFGDKALDTVEVQIYADAYQTAISPASVPVGTLREHIEVDETGRKIKSFSGDPEACWGSFKATPRMIGGITTKFPH